MDNYKEMSEEELSEIKSQNYYDLLNMERLQFYIVHENRAKETYDDEKIACCVVKLDNIIICVIFSDYSCDETCALFNEEFCADYYDDYYYFVEFLQEISELFYEFNKIETSTKNTLLKTFHNIEKENYELIGECLSVSSESYIGIIVEKEDYFELLSKTDNNVIMKVKKLIHI